MESNCKRYSATLSPQNIHWMFWRASIFTVVFIYLLHCWLTIGAVSVSLVLQSVYEHMCQSVF